MSGSAQDGCAVAHSSLARGPERVSEVGEKTSKDELLNGE
jgi:hypothetical protein